VIPVLVCHALHEGDVVLVGDYDGLPPAEVSVNLEDQWRLNGRVLMQVLGDLVRPRVVHQPRRVFPFLFQRSLEQTVVIGGDDEPEWKLCQRAKGGGRTLSLFDVPVKAVDQVLAPAAARRVGEERDSLETEGVLARKVVLRKLLGKLAFIGQLLRQPLREKWPLGFFISEC
jgi:hypothetical protein